jgi:hypothetical protein
MFALAEVPNTLAPPYASTTCRRPSSTRLTKNHSRGNGE